MVVRAIAQRSIGRNGVGAFVQPCKKITLQYCNWGGSSQGMREFLKSKQLDKLALNEPHIQFEVVRKSGHPIVRAHYTNGREKVICVRGEDRNVVENRIKQLKECSGEILHKRVAGHNVETLNTSVRGIWSPLHAARKHRV
ncbi:Large ribosomal subunit protein mL43 [Nakaseomyces bracarensis]|uniref:Large ribosomal subunit protein mL43 n=1 Tax=Nakaseomyces bracarensis TaxID=273131 RepID=A0ABR4NR89_9SACH